MYENINGLKGGQGVELNKSIDGAWQINANGTDKEENIPVEPAVAQISRQWVNSEHFHNREVLSCVMTMGGDSFQVPFDIRLSGASGTYGMGYNDASRWLLSSMPDTNLSVEFTQAGDDGVAIKLGVYYI